MILVGPFQPGIFCDPMSSFSKHQQAWWLVFSVLTVLKNRFGCFRRTASDPCCSLASSLALPLVIRAITARKILALSQLVRGLLEGLLRGLLSPSPPVLTTAEICGPLPPIRSTAQGKLVHPSVLGMPESLGLLFAEGEKIITLKTALCY